MVWAALSGGMGLAGLFMALTGGSTFALLVDRAGTLFFGGIAAILALRLFDRRPQVIIDKDGLYVRSHGERRIPLRAINTMGTDAHSKDNIKLAIFLFKPAKYPIETRHRRFIWRINGSDEAQSHRHDFRRRRGRFRGRSGHGERRAQQRGGVFSRPKPGIIFLSQGQLDNAHPCLLRFLPFTSAAYTQPEFSVDKGITHRPCP